MQQQLLTLQRGYIMSSRCVASSAFCFGAKQIVLLEVFKKSLCRTISLWRSAAVQHNSGVKSLCSFFLRKAVFTAGKSAARERERAHYRLHKSLFVLLRPFPCVLQHWLKEQVPKRAYTSRACVFLKMTFYLCVSGCGRYLAPRDGHERCIACLGLAHAEAAFVDESCTHCGKMTISELRSRLQLLQRGGVPVPLPRSNPPQRVAAGGDTGDLRITVSAFPSGNQPPRNPHSSCTPQPAELPEERGGLSQRCTPSVSFGAPLDDRMSIAALEGESDFSRDDASAQLPPSGTVAVPDTDPEMMAMLSRAANRVGLMWNPPPCPEPSRLDDWFLGVARAGSQPPTPVPFFPEVHEELTGTWKAPFTARNRASGPSSLTTLDGGAAKGYTRIPPVERAVAMQLCPNSTWRGEPSLPSRACKHSSDLTGRAYQAWGEAASALHAMALLQVHQAKALRDLHEGGHDPQVHHELRVAMDLALRATTLSTLVVQERHLWLCLADMRDTDKVRFLNSPVSQTGLFGDVVENFAQQFSAVQKQSEAISHILPRRSAVASTLPPAAPQPARRRGRPPATAPAPAPQQQPPPKRRRGASRKLLKSDCSSGDGDCTVPSPGGGPGGKSFVFSFCSAAGPAASGTQIFNKRAVSVISRSEEGSKSSGRSKTSPLSSTSSVTSGQQRAVRDGHPSLSCTPCPTVEPGKCCRAHSDPAKGRLPKRAPRAASLRSTSLPHCGYASGPLGPTCAVSASLVSAPQSVSLAHSDHQAMNIWKLK